MRRAPVLALALIFAAGAAFAAGPLDEQNEEEEVTRSAAYMEASALVEAEAFELAHEKLMELSEEEPMNADVFNLLGFAARNIGDFDGAAAAYRRALALDPDHRGALEYQGQLYLALNEFEEAEANLARLSELCPSGCEEKAELEAAMDAWRTENGS
ncbi:MAG: tetratricopeptide repeat protein [Pseudomonadota bacterium]